MNIKQEKSYGIVGTSILDINNREMRQMCEMKERIAQVLNTHTDEKVKNEYLSDDELEMIMTILTVFTKEYEVNETSAFDDALRELHQSPKSTDVTPVEEPEQQ